MGKMQLMTAGGYLYGDVISALQKCIRRGMEEEAGYWAFELWPKYQKALWQRLIIILHEDIGLANPGLIPFVQAAKQQYDLMVKEGGQKLILANVIVAMCRSEKSRLADHFQCIQMQRRSQHGWRLEVPDFAHDKHTLKGKMLGRGMQHFLEEGAKLFPQGHVPDPYSEEAASLWLSMPAKKKVPVGTQDLFEDADPDDVE